jgi:pimeloyl-ACP methyl ester carboxylesterase
MVGDAGGLVDAGVLEPTCDEAGTAPEGGEVAEDLGDPWHRGDGSIDRVGDGSEEGRAEGVNLTTHITDVVNTILFEDLHDVVLTGHSYGGRVITGVMNRIPERIRHVMFFDASVPEDGESGFSRQGGPPADMVVKNGRRIPSWLNENPTKFPHNVGHPIGTSTEAVAYNNPAAFALNVTYVPFIPVDQDPAERAGRDQNWKNAVARGWTVRTFPGSHTAMLENPKDLAVLMQKAVSDTNTPVAK